VVEQVEAGRPPAAAQRGGTPPISTFRINRGLAAPGVVTTAQVSGDGRDPGGFPRFAALDQLGLAQKGGRRSCPTSDFSINPIDGANKTTDGRPAACIWVATSLVAAAERNLSVASPSRTVAVVSTSEVPTGRPWILEPEHGRFRASTSLTGLIAGQVPVEVCRCTPTHPRHRNARVRVRSARKTWSSSGWPSRPAPSRSPSNHSRRPSR